MNNLIGNSTSKFFLLHINSYYVTSNLHAELIAKICARNIQQVIFVPVGRKNRIDVNVIQGLDNTSFVYKKSYSSFSRFLWPLKIMDIWNDFKVVLKSKGKPDIIHAHSLIVNGLIAYLSYRKNKTPYIITVRATDVNIFLKVSFIFRGIATKILKASSGIMFLSPSYKNLYIKKLLSANDYEIISNKSSIIPNGMNDFWLNNLAKMPKKIDNSINKILFVGKLNRRKNIKGLIAACKYLHNNNVDLTLTVVGEGPLKKELMDSHLDFQVSFLGYISDREQLIGIYRNSHILAVPSFTESFGLVYAEAISQGLPVIYSKDQGIDGYFPDGYIGFAVNPKSPKDIADKILLIKSNYSQLSSNALKSSDHFSWKNTTDSILELYEKALSKA